MPRPAIHPGEILADELEELGVTPTELSRQIAVPTNRITQIINGQRSITGDTALRLGHWFKTSAQFWLNLQSPYDIRLAEQQAGAAADASCAQGWAARADRIALSGSVGLAESTRSRVTNQSVWVIVRRCRRSCASMV